MISVITSITALIVATFGVRCCCKAYKVLADPTNAEDGTHDPYDRHLMDMAEQEGMRQH